MTKPFKIVRERWSLEEILSDELRPGYGAFALVLDDEHFAHFKHPIPREIALALESTASGGEGRTIKFGHDQIRIEKRPGGVTMWSPANAERIFSIHEARGLARDLTSPLEQTLTPAP